MWRIIDRVKIMPIFEKLPVLQKHHLEGIINENPARLPTKKFAGETRRSKNKSLKSTALVHDLSQHNVSPWK